MYLGANHRTLSRLELPTVTLNGTPLVNTPKYKYLGLTLTPELTLEDQTKKSIGMASSKINTLAYLRKYVGTTTALQIYKSTVLPLMEYANFTYPLVPVSLRKKLQRLQNRALKIIYQINDNQSLPELHITAKLTSLDQRANRQLACLMYKRSLCPISYPHLPNPRATRSTEKIRFNLPRPNNEKFKKFPLYAGSQIWDRLDQLTQHAPDYTLFKSRLSKTPDFDNFPVI